MKGKEQLEQLREMNLDELKEQADSFERIAVSFEIQKILGVGESVNDIRREKKTLARVYTLINEKEAEAIKSN